MKVVLSVGGSLLNPGKPDFDFIEKLTSLLKRLKTKYRFAVVCGGGVPAREQASHIRKLGGSEFLADETAILCTRMNALLMMASLGDDAYPSLAESFREAVGAMNSGKIVLMGGTIPGITTDTDAALLAEGVGAARIVNLSNVDGVYTSDPRKNKDAKKMSRMGFIQLVELASKYDKRKAGTRFIFDLIACKLIARSGIETHFVYGKNLDELQRAIEGKTHSGTVVK
ncbi:UMP kinase [Candidatus Micrarchaeota archaeon]|nr:UMP kinase [Candidatus Micrarchaeota archaeon]